MTCRTASGAVALTTAAVAALLTTAPTATAATTTFTPVADTYVQGSTPSTNYGASPQFVVDNSPVRQSFLKFTASGVTDPVTSAKLRIRTISGNNGNNNGGTFKAMTNTMWSETGTTWNNKPAVDGNTLGTLGSVVRDTWYEIDVTSLVTGNGTFSIGATSPNNDGAYYDSRESGADAPQLVITTGTTPPPSGDPVLVGVGDISNSGTGDSATANLLDNIPGTVFTAGDNAYDSGTATEFATYYDPTWGRHKARTRPAPGNHDYNTSGATGYYNYFGANAGPSGRGYYSYDLGNWHVVSLNSDTLASRGAVRAATTSCSRTPAQGRCGWRACTPPTSRTPCLVSNGLSPMGFALPGAIAAKLARPDRRVLAMMGDGSFLMNSQELGTAVRERMPLVVLVLVDEEYGLITWKMELELGRHSHTRFTNPNLVAHAESFDARGYRIETADQLLPVLRRALDDDTVYVIACPVDYSENLRLTDRLGSLHGPF
ncbi:CBM96 family carbohydrate-binding protein [Streptomyces sp. NPDC054833]